MSLTIVNLPIGAHCAFGFVFRDMEDQLIDLHAFTFILTATYPGGSLRFDTTVDTTVLYIEEDAEIEPIGKPAYVSDRLILSLAPVHSRKIPKGVLTTWEIERRLDVDQRNWGIGMFRGFGGDNPDD